ncbi:MAG TPA: hypothetical protein VI431_14970 [Candidatus Acidoferrum sp.]
MSAARRLLIVGGIALALLGMIYGMWYAVFAEHQELDGMGKSLTVSFIATAKGDSVAAGAALREYRKLKYSYDRHVDGHGHWIGLAMVLVVLGIALERVGFNERLTMLLAVGLVLGSFLFPLGVLLQTFSHGPAPQAVAVVGSALVILSLAGMTVGFAVPGTK